MNPYNLNPGSDSLQYLHMAEKLLTTRDLIGSKSFATKARESDPNSQAAEQILAIIDTLIAGDKQISSNHLDWYSILQLARRTHDSELIALQYKRLGVLLNPNRNKFPFAEHAYKLVTEAWLVLSNPSRKFQFDNEFGNSNFNFNFMETQFEVPRVQEQRNKQIGGGSGGVHFDFMQDGSGGEMNQSNSIQFVQQQQQGFGQQAIPFFGEEQRVDDGQNINQQLHWSNQGKQSLVRPQPQQALLRPHSQQTWFQQPETQSHIQQLQPQPQQQQPTHWAQSHQQPTKPQSQPQPQPQPEPESGEQSTQPLHWAQHVPQRIPMSQAQPQSWMQEALPRPHIQQSLTELLTEIRPLPESPEQPQQPLHLSQPVPVLPLESGEQPQQPFHSSQPVPQIAPLSQPQPWMQQSSPSPQIQTSLPEPQPQPEKTPPESREWVNNGEQFNLGENGNNDDTHDNNVSAEELPNFWTVCPYCFSMHEYPGIYADCALRCQNCKKAFHASKAEAPPAVGDGEDAYLCCWGFFPIGVSMSYLEKRNAEASSWQPFSKMFAFRRGGNTSASPQGGTEFAFPQKGNTSKPRKPRNTGPRIYIDDDEEEDIFDGISSNDESDDDDWRYAQMNKKARRYKKRVSTAMKVKQPQVSAEMAQHSNTGNLHSAVATQDGLVLPSVTLPKAAMDDADKGVVETSKEKVFVPIRKQPSRVAKDLVKLDGVVAHERSGVSVPEAAEVSFSPVDQPTDCGKLDGVTGVDGVIAQEESGFSVSDTAVLSVPTRKQPGGVEKDLEKLDGVDSVVAQGGSVVSIPDVAAVSVPARKRPGRVAKDSGKLDGVVAQEGLGVSVPDMAAPSVPVTEADKKVMGEAEKKAVGGSGKKRVSVPTRKQPGRIAKDLESWT